MRIQWAVVEALGVAEAALGAASELEEDSVVVVDSQDVEAMVVALEVEAVATAEDLPPGVLLVVLLLQATLVVWKLQIRRTPSPTLQHLVARRIQSSTFEM